MVQFNEIDRFLCFGSGEVLIDAVEFARQHGFETAVVTAPRHKSGTVRGEQFITLLESMDVETVVAENVNDEEVLSLIDHKTMGLSFGAAWIFKQNFIEQFDDDAFVNFHGSRLPKDRGGGGFSWRILRDDRIGYSQVHLIKPSIDTGDILMTDEYEFPARCQTPSEFDDFATKKESEFACDFIKSVKDKHNFDSVGQPSYLSSYWPRLSTDIHGYIDWDWSLEEIVRFTRAFSDPFEGAKTFIRGQEVRLKNCNTSKNDGTFHPFQTGIVYRKHNNRAYVATSEGTLIVKIVIDKKGDSHFNDIVTGDRFYTPDEHLTRARRTRVFYTPTGMRQEEY